MAADKFLDAKYLKCPMPIIKIAKAMKDIEAGQTLEVHATDPVFIPDLNAWCKKVGNDLLEIKEEADYVAAIIKKSA